MKTLRQLNTEISDIILHIETNYPDVYKYLDENPITIPHDSKPDIDKRILKEYLESLKALIQKYKEGHQ